jgi:hypothetical protein
MRLRRRDPISGGALHRRIGGQMARFSMVQNTRPGPAVGLSQTADVGGIGAPRASDPPRSGLRCPIYNCVYKGLSLTDRI